MKKIMLLTFLTATLALGLYTGCKKDQAMNTSADQWGTVTGDSVRYNTITRLFTPEGPLKGPCRLRRPLVSSIIILEPPGTLIFWFISIPVLKKAVRRWILRFRYRYLKTWT